jgi:transposase-like protein
MAAIYPDLKNITLFQLMSAIADRKDAVAWATANGLIAGSRHCRQCPGPIAMRLEPYKAADGVRWRCPTCRSTMSLRHESFYSRSKLSLKENIMVNMFVIEYNMN